MRRRQLLALASAAGAGCVGHALPGGQGPDATATTDEPHVVVDPPPGETYVPNTRLSVVSTVNGEVRARMRLVEVDSDAVAHDAVHGLSFADRVVLDDRFEPDTGYRFALSVGGSTLFDRPIQTHEGYELALRSREAVEVLGHVEA